MATGVQPLAIDSDEGKALAEAIANVAAEYEVVVNRKMMAWLGLLATAAGIYGPRALTVYAMTRAQKQSQAVHRTAPDIPTPDLRGMDFSGLTGAQA